MTHFIEGLDRQQTMLLPDHLDDYVDENSPVRAIDAFADMLDLAVLGFSAQSAATGRPGYHPGLMLRIYLYGYLNQVQSSRRCCQTNENSHRIAGAALIYALNSWRHSVRAAVRLSLKLSRE